MLALQGEPVKRQRLWPRKFLFETPSGRFAALFTIPEPLG